MILWLPNLILCPKENAWSVEKSYWAVSTKNTVPTIAEMPTTTCSTVTVKIWCATSTTNSVNYRILDSFPLKDGKTKTTKMRLLDKGFDFEYITNLYTTKKGSTYYFVYDLGYLPLDNDYYMIVKRE